MSAPATGPSAVPRPATIWTPTALVSAIISGVSILVGLVSLSLALWVRYKSTARWELFSAATRARIVEDRSSYGVKASVKRRNSCEYCQNASRHLGLLAVQGEQHPNYMQRAPFSASFPFTETERDQKPGADPARLWFPTVCPHELPQRKKDKRPSRGNGAAGPISHTYRWLLPLVSFRVEVPFLRSVKSDEAECQPLVGDLQDVDSAEKGGSVSSRQDHGTEEEAKDEAVVLSVPAPADINGQEGTGQVERNVTARRVEPHRAVFDLDAISAGWVGGNEFRGNGLRNTGFWPPWRAFGDVEIKRPLWPEFRECLSKLALPPVCAYVDPPSAVAGSRSILREVDYDTCLRQTVVLTKIPNTTHCSAYALAETISIASRFRRFEYYPVHLGSDEEAKERVFFPSVKYKYESVTSGHFMDTGENYGIRIDFGDYWQALTFTPTKWYTTPDERTLVAVSAWGVTEMRLQAGVLVIVFSSPREHQFDVSLFGAAIFLSLDEVPYRIPVHDLESRMQSWEGEGEGADAPVPPHVAQKWRTDAQHKLKRDPWNHGQRYPLLQMIWQNRFFGWIDVSRQLHIHLAYRDAKLLIQVIQALGHRFLPPERKAGMVAPTDYEADGRALQGHCMVMLRTMIDVFLDGNVNDASFELRETIACQLQRISTCWSWWNDEQDCENPGCHGAACPRTSRSVVRADFRNGGDAVGIRTADSDVAQENAINPDNPLPKCRKEAACRCRLHRHMPAYLTSLNNAPPPSTEVDQLRFGLPLASVAGYPDNLAQLADEHYDLYFHTTRNLLLWCRTQVRATRRSKLTDLLAVLDFVAGLELLARICNIAHWIRPLPRVAESIRPWEYRTAYVA